MNMTYPTINIVVNYLSTYFGMMKISTTPILNTLGNIMGNGSFYALRMEWLLEMSL